MKNILFGALVLMSVSACADPYGNTLIGAGVGALGGAVIGSALTPTHQYQRPYYPAPRNNYYAPPVYNQPQYYTPHRPPTYYRPVQPAPRYNYEYAPSYGVYRRHPHW